jgi:hypothetical protein
MEKEYRFRDSPYRKNGLRCLVINDFAWWMSNEDSICKWMQDSKVNAVVDRRDMVIEFGSHEQLEWFKLVWGTSA